MKKGTLYIMRVQDWKLIEGLSGNKVFGVRIAKFLPEGWIHLPNTGPSKNLLLNSKNLEKKQLWNEKVFKEFYLPNYLKNVKNEASKREFLQIKKMLDDGEDVYYACYCQKEHLCHRSIVREFFRKKGYSVCTFKKS